ncbi:MAG: prephenate dehydrogenase [Candidatus Omnitrophota bacterium]
MKLKKVVIIGTGLIGGSIGKALLEKDLADEVIGICRRRSSLDRAMKERVVSKGYVNDYGKAIQGAEVILIATPVHTIEEVLDRLAESPDIGSAVVTDVGSTKKEIVNYAAKYRDKFSFIGGHPLAGSEKTGVEYSAPDLFHDSICVLTPDEWTREENIKKLKKLWETIGARVIIMDPEKHDENLALSSHLPHVVAFALAGTIEEDFPREVLASGFKDTTRIASSDPGLWSDIFLSNRDNILKAVERFRKVLSGIADDIRKNRKEALKEDLDKCKKVRDGIS